MNKDGSHVGYEYCEHDLRPATDIADTVECRKCHRLFNMFNDEEDDMILTRSYAAVVVHSKKRLGWKDHGE